MRDIKFRAWSHNLKKMFYDNYMFEKNGSTIWQQYKRIEGMMICETDNLNAELMQFTGLKDCGGVEIFEGDKIQVDEYYIGDHLQNPFIGEVRYSNGSYEVADSENAACEQLDRESIFNYSMKVIGNIFE